MQRRYDRAAEGLRYRAISLAGFGGLEPWFRSQTVSRLGLRQGDAVLDVACGQGANFLYLHRAVGGKGRIVGVDYSSGMLERAAERVRRNRWANVELVRTDAAEMAFDREFAGAICTVAMAVIPRWERAIERMRAALRPRGRAAVLDGRPGRGAYRAWNPYVRAFAKVVGAHLDRDIPAGFRRVFPDAVEEPFLGPFYFILSGTAP